MYIILYVESSSESKRNCLDVCVETVRLYAFWKAKIRRLMYVFYSFIRFVLIEAARGMINLFLFNFFRFPYNE